MISWIFTLMVAAQPEAPWKGTYQATAEAIAAVVDANGPVFDGEDGAKKTAALLVAIAWAESRFNPNAVGDQGRSVGLYQLFESNVPTPEGYHRTDILGHPENATRVAHRMVRYSLEFCAKFPAMNRLGAYTGGSCTGEKAVWQSRYRMKLAMKLFEEHPESSDAQSGNRPVSEAIPAPAPEKPPPTVPERSHQPVVLLRSPEPKRTGERRPSVHRRVETPREPVDESSMPVFRLTPEETRMIEGKGRR